MYSALKLQKTLVYILFCKIPVVVGKRDNAMIGPCSCRVKGRMFGSPCYPLCNALFVCLFSIKTELLCDMLFVVQISLLRDDHFVTVKIASHGLTCHSIHDLCKVATVDTFVDVFLRNS